MPALHRRGAALLVDGFAKALRAGGDERYRQVVDRLHRKVYPAGFVVQGIRYCPEPCSVGLTPGGEITGLSAADLIRERDLSDLHVLDLCCGVGLVGFSLLARLKDERVVRRMTFADINVFNVLSVKRTAERNPPDLWGDAEIDVVLSDGLKHVEPARQFDLIVSNPPHFFAESFTKEAVVEPSDLGTLDAGWVFHREFYDVAHEYLSERGEIWFLENHLARGEDELLRIVERNSSLEVTDVFDDSREERAFWMISRRARTAAAERAGEP